MKKIALSAILLGVLAVILGAFGAHSLEEQVTDKQLAAWKTGVQYQFIHVLVICFVSLLYVKTPSRILQWAGRVFLLGICLFSGSIYLLTTRALTGIPDVLISVLGPLTPLGGVCFIAGWILLTISVSQSNAFSANNAK